MLNNSMRSPLITRIALGSILAPPPPPPHSWFLLAVLWFVPVPKPNVTSTKGTSVVSPICTASPTTVSTLIIFLNFSNRTSKFSFTLLFSITVPPLFVKVSLLYVQYLGFYTMYLLLYDIYIICRPYILS